MGRGRTKYIISAWGISDVGLMRDHNEDSFIISDEYLLYAVADGMGGHAGGSTASRLAIEALYNEIQKAFGHLPTSTSSLPPSPLETESKGKPANPESNPGTSNPGTKNLPAEEKGRIGLLRGFANANHDIFVKSENEPSLMGMGTTLTALLIVNKTAYFGHVGDSRAYLIREGRIIQLSEDHSLVYEHVKAGLITPEQAKESFFRNIITRSVGTESHLVVDSFSVEIKKDDIFLLCSDGLVTMLSDEEILDAVFSNTLNDVPEILVDMANERGGEDNITVILAHVDTDPTIKPVSKQRRKKKRGVGTRKDI